MAEKCNDPNNQRVAGAFPETQAQNAGALQVNLDESADSIFNPNNALSAVNTYLTMNNVANKMFGIEARWFRAVPQERSKEVILQEWTLYCVEEKPICLKVLLPDGNFPESQYQYDLMGLEYEVPLTVHIDKKYWEEMAGFGTAPQKKDIVYLPMPNKLYQVESSYLERGFMEQETHWVLNLRKYMPEASRRESKDLKDTIDQYTVSEQELFGEDLQNEYDKITNDKQFSPFNSTTQDKYKSVDPTLEVVASTLSIYGLTVAEAFYDLKTSTDYNAIVYNYTDEITAGDDRAITAWVNARPITGKRYPVTMIQADSTITPPANYKIKINTVNKFSIGDTFVISRPGALNFYAKVVDDANANVGIYFCQIDDDVVNYLNSLNSNWTTAKGYTMQLNDPITILDGINETDTGFQVHLYANQYLKIKYGSQTHVAALPESMNFEQWYGIVVNIGNTTSTYGAYLWEIDPNDSFKKLKLRASNVIPFRPEATDVGTYSVDRSNSYMTNIRMFSTIIEESNQDQELLSYFTKDSDQALILDNADPRFLAPYISQQR